MITLIIVQMANKLVRSARRFARPGRKLNAFVRLFPARPRSSFTRSSHLAWSGFLQRPLTNWNPLAISYALDAAAR